MKKLALIALALGAVAAAQAAPYFYSGALTANSPTFDNPGGSSLGSGIHHYSAFEFTVSVSGAYTFEMSSPNTSTTGQSNALDTYLRLYATTFNPGAPGTGLASNDDFTGALTVLPGPYSGTIGGTGTGFTGAQPSSRLNAIALTAGTTYFLINTSFRETTYVTPLTGNVAGATGPYYVGINGPGNVNPVPEPASMAALGLGVLALLRRRKK
jgi:hypothetical protein